MTEGTKIGDTLQNTKLRPKDLFTGYEGSGGQPLGAYAGLAGTFGALFAGFVWGTERVGRPLPQRMSPGDIALLGVATHKLSWVITNASVASFMRAPVTEVHQGEEDSTDQEEVPSGGGLQWAVGKLMLCHFCLGMWVSASSCYAIVVAPRTTRFFATILVILTASDFLHQAYKTVINRA